MIFNGFQADMTGAVKTYIATGDPDSLIRWQFRIRHATESNGDDTINKTEWAAAENTGDIYRPELRVTYR